MFDQHNANDILGLVYICTVKKKKKNERITFLSFSNNVAEHLFTMLTHLKYQALNSKHHQSKCQIQQLEFKVHAFYFNMLWFVAM